MQSGERVHDRRGLRSANRSLAFPFVALLALAGCSESSSDAPTTGAPSGSEPAGASATSPVRVQVSLAWGGGVERDWRGDFGLARDDGPRARLRWLWFADFELGDHGLPGEDAPPHWQGVPSGWRPSTPADLGKRGEDVRLAPRGGGSGAALQTTTRGDADGVSFEAFGHPETRVVLDFGTDARLEATLGELVERPRVLAVDESGNALLASAVDLGRNAPASVDHAGRAARRTSLHTHSCFSSNQMQLEPVHASLRPFVDSVWWTDHSVGDERRLFAGDFEDADVVATFWRTFVEGATTHAAGRRADPERGGHVWAMELEAVPDAPGRVLLHQAGGGGEFNLGLCARPNLRWSQRRSGVGESPVVVQVVLHSGRKLRYISGAVPQPNRATDIALDSSPGEWETFERDVVADARRLYGELGTDGFRRVLVSTVAAPGARAEVELDDLEVVVPAPHEIATAQAAVLDALRDPVGHPALEQSAWTGADDTGALFPHLTMLVPRDAPEHLTGLDRPPTDAERRAYVERVQAVGGAVGTHHMQLDDHYEAFLDGSGFGADLFELGGAWWFVPAWSTPAERAARDALGYPPFDEDELFPVLVRWDRLTARGLFLTAYGAPDLHQLFEAPSYGWLNRWLTWVFAEDDSPEAQLRALRRGQACASEWKSDAILSLDVEGREWMGKLVATDRERATVRARVTGAIPGSTLRWIAGPLVRATPDADGFEPEPARVLRTDELEAGALVSSIAVDTSAGVFVRAELFDPTGHLVAVANPVTFVPGWPAEWPVGRVGFDWGGAVLESQRGVLLEDARVRADGALLLEGTAGGEGGELVVAGRSPRLLDEGSRWAVAEHQLAADGSGDALRLTLEAGAFEVALAFAEALAPGATWGLHALPPRKELFLELDLGDPESEGDWKGAGFTEPFTGSLLLGEMRGSTRALARGRARFELDVPEGEPTWLELVRFGWSPVTGELLVDGESVGRFEALESLVFELPATDPDSAESRRRAFDLVLDAPAPPDHPLTLDRIRLWRGPGVVDY